jgi:hypothetical protein
MPGKRLGQGIAVEVTADIKRVAIPAEPLPDMAGIRVVLVEDEQHRQLGGPLYSAVGVFRTLVCYLALRHLEHFFRLPLRSAGADRATTP